MNLTYETNIVSEQSPIPKSESLGSRKWMGLLLLASTRTLVATRVIVAISHLWSFIYPLSVLDGLNLNLSGLPSATIAFLHLHTMVGPVPLSTPGPSIGISQAIETVWTMQFPISVP